jgi:hypothetical protein
MFGKAPKWRTTHFSSKELLGLQKKLNRMFYLNPAYLLRMLGKLRSFSELAYYAKSGAAFLKWVAGMDLSAGGLREMDLDDSTFEISTV